MKQTPAFSASLDAARVFSVRHGINYISSQLICYSAIEHDAELGFMMTDPDRFIFFGKLSEELMLEPKISKDEGENLPLTEEAQIVIRLAIQYMEAFEEEILDTKHYLLAILSCDTRCMQLLKERGVIFRTFLEKLAERMDVVVDFPGQLYPQTDYIPRKRSMSLLHGLFNPKAKEALGLRYLQDSLQLMEFKEVERSLQALSMATDNARKDEQFFQIKANVLLRAKKWDEALSTTQEALAKGFSTDDLYIGQALALYELNAYDECMELCKRQWNTPRYSADACNLIGFTLSRINDHKLAIEYFDKALLIQPDYAFALDNKGYSLFRTGAVEAGVHLINESLQIDKGNSYAYRNLAIIAKESGDTDQAMIMAEKAFLFGYKQDYGDDLDGLVNQP